MTNIVPFVRKTSATRSAPAGPAAIIMFPGVRYERIPSSQDDGQKKQVGKAGGRSPRSNGSKR
ncbi:hypothetical protein [Mesorhizobium xinjiangense]|uniref:hypothetical protein n=1 Tax=Mesorhizobium xinjiangense TaxID=2678685 RepID=UPI0012EE9E0E|nr:hypothetical protein [Mesorhizobium xinjiangense]